MHEDVMTESQNGTGQPMFEWVIESGKAKIPALSLSKIEDGPFRD
jgi:hypothetical protein